MEKVEELRGKLVALIDEFETIEQVDLTSITTLVPVEEKDEDAVVEQLLQVADQLAQEILKALDKVKADHEGQKCQLVDASKKLFGWHDECSKFLDWVDKRKGKKKKKGEAVEKKGEELLKKLEELLEVTRDFMGIAEMERILREDHGAGGAVGKAKRMSEQLLKVLKKGTQELKNSVDEQEVKNRGVEGVCKTLVLWKAELRKYMDAKELKVKQEEVEKKEKAYLEVALKRLGSRDRTADLYFWNPDNYWRGYQGEGAG